MTVTVEYEAEEKLDLPYEEIIKNVIEESLDYVECPYDAEVNFPILKKHRRNTLTLTQGSYLWGIS